MRESSLAYLTLVPLFSSVDEHMFLLVLHPGEHFSAHFTAKLIVRIFCFNVHFFFTYSRFIAIKTRLALHSSWVIIVPETTQRVFFGNIFNFYLNITFFFNFFVVDVFLFSFNAFIHLEALPKSYETELFQPVAFVGYEIIDMLWSYRLIKICELRRGWPRKGFILWEVSR